MSPENAIEITKKMFSTVPDTVAYVDDVARAYERNLEAKNNKQWLQNKLVELKKHGLVEPVYVRKNNRKVLGGVRLTTQGMNLTGKTPMTQEQAEGELHGRKNHTHLPNMPANKMLFNKQDLKGDTGIDDVLEIIEKFQRDNPRVVVRYNFELRGNTSGAYKG